MPMLYYRCECGASWALTIASNDICPICGKRSVEMGGATDLLTSGKDDLLQYLMEQPSEPKGEIFFECVCGTIWEIEKDMFCPACGKMSFGITYPYAKYYMSFRLWLERHFVTIPKELQDQIVGLAKVKDNKSLLAYLRRDGYPKHLIGDAQIDGYSVPVYLDNVPAARCLKLPDETSIKEILLPYQGNVRQTINDLWHEFGHASDPKTKSTEWEPTDRHQELEAKIQQGIPLTPEEEKSYVKEPVEFEAYAAEFASRVHNSCQNN